jgi:hypothetical protein
MNTQIRKLLSIHLKLLLPMLQFVPVKPEAHVHVYV